VRALEDSGLYISKIMSTLVHQSKWIYIPSLFVGNQCCCNCLIFTVTYIDKYCKSVHLQIMCYRNMCSAGHVYFEFKKQLKIVTPALCSERRAMPASDFCG